MPQNIMAQQWFMYPNNNNDEKCKRKKPQKSKITHICKTATKNHLPSGKL